MARLFYFIPGMYYINPWSAQPVTFVAGASTMPSPAPSAAPHPAPHPAPRPAYRPREVFEQVGQYIYLYSPSVGRRVQTETPREFTRFLSEIAHRKLIETPPTRLPAPFPRRH